MYRMECLIRKIMEFDTDTVENLEFVSQLYLDRFKVPKVNYMVKINPEQNIGIGDSIFVKAKQFEIFTEIISYDYNVLTKRVEALEVWKLPTNSQELLFNTQSRYRSSSQSQSSGMD